MIVKRHFTPASMWPYARFELALASVSSVSAWLLVDRAGWTQWTLPAAVATVLGTALSILLAVRANTSYQRWWEGSAIWAQIVGLSCTVVRVVRVALAALAAHLQGLAPAERDVLRGSDNKAIILLAGQSACIFGAYRDGLLTGLDNFQMETALAALSTQQALAERISMQPVPRAATSTPPPPRARRKASPPPIRCSARWPPA